MRRIPLATIDSLDLDAILELCPCVRRQTHADTVFHGCDQIVCNCYYLGEGKDPCLWPGHETLNRVRAVIEVLRAAILKVLSEAPDGALSHEVLDLVDAALALVVEGGKGGESVYAAEKHDA